MPSSPPKKVIVSSGGSETLWKSWSLREFLVQTEANRTSWSPFNIWLTQLFSCTRKSTSSFLQLLLRLVIGLIYLHYVWAHMHADACILKWLSWSCYSTLIRSSGEFSQPGTAAWKTCIISSGSYARQASLPGNTVKCRSNCALADTPPQPQRQNNCRIR